MPSTHADCQVRWMIRRDMDEVLAIENACFEHPWTEEDFLTELRKTNCIGMVAECHERIRGFMIYGLEKLRLEVLNFAVDPQFHRQGVGSRMAWKLIDKLAVQRRNRIVLRCRESNLAAQLFFSRMGFDATKVDRGYFDGNEDAYRFEYRLRTEEEIANPFSPVNRVTKYL